MTIRKKKSFFLFIMDSCFLSYLNFNLVSYLKFVSYLNFNFCFNLFFCRVFNFFFFENVFILNHFITQNLILSKYLLLNFNIMKFLIHQNFVFIKEQANEAIGNSGFLRILFMAQLIKENKKTIQRSIFSRKQKTNLPKWWFVYSLRYQFYDQRFSGDMLSFGPCLWHKEQDHWVNL